MLLIIICGPSLAGKDMLVNEFILSKLGYKLISTTTREPREGEVHGVDYYFVTHEEFEEAVANQKFFEHVTYGVDKNGEKATRYGFYRSELDKLKLGPVFAIVTPEGAEKLKQHVGKVKIFYVKTDPKVRAEKALSRYGDKVEEYRKQIDARIKIDEEIFDGFEDRPDVIVLNNNYDRDSFVNNIKLIMEEIYDLKANGTVEQDIIEKEVEELKKQEKERDSNERQN